MKTQDNFPRIIGLLTALAVISAIAHIRAEYLGPAYHIYIFKPLTMVFILLIALLTTKAVSARYKILIVIGLLFSMAGDIFLMLPGDMFIAGLVSFLVAHIFYIAAFGAGHWRRFVWWSPLPFALYGLLLVILLAPSLGPMLAPVLVYIVVIMTMAWRAWERWLQTRRKDALLALIGAILFAISDSFLAFNKFQDPFWAARLLTLTTYFTAQWFIALSVYAHGRGRQ